MGIYAVYTRIKKGDGTDKEIMVMNIESTSCGGAEHKILDIHNSITNALAFDMANPIYFVNYITQYDFEDFKKRYISTVKKRQEAIDEVFDEIKEIQADNNELTKQIDEIKNQISQWLFEAADYTATATFEYKIVKR